MAKNSGRAHQVAKEITAFRGSAWRIIETQEITALRKLVDSIEEQLLLEELLEEVKPVLLDAYRNLHPWLSAPFRYPPLKYGSRFGSRNESSLWYGSLELRTAMAEKAFYQFNFLVASQANFGNIEVPLTAFSVKIKTDVAIRLETPPFRKHSALLSSPTSYEFSQALGKRIRKAGVALLTYISARDINKKINVGLFNPTPFFQKKPLANSFQSWRLIGYLDERDENKKINLKSQSAKAAIEFIKTSALKIDHYRFPLSDFLIGRHLPFPAN